MNPIKPISSLLSRARRNSEPAEPGASKDRKGWPKFVVFALLIAFGLLAAYFWLTLTPRAKFFEPGAIEIEFDRPTDRGMFGITYQGPGLYLRYGIGLRGDPDGDYELKVSAYLLSSDSGSFKDQSQYLRRARFLNPAGDESNLLEGPEGWNDLYLPYQVIVDGTVQGGFANYRPLALKKLLAANPDTHFAVEVSVAIQERSHYPGEDIKVRSQTRRIVPLDYENVPPQQREHFLRSQWAAMLAGEDPDLAVTVIGQPEIISEALQPLSVRGEDDAEGEDDATEEDGWVDF